MSEIQSLDSMRSIHVADPQLFLNGDILDVLATLRAHDPVHYCDDSPYGPYWSVTRYSDIMQVDKDYETFSSDAHLGGVMIDDDIVGDVDSEFFVKAFITTDPPDHSPQRKAVNKIVTQPSLANFATIIRKRTSDILDELPIGEPFDWVNRVSIELTTQMLATLFDFPFEDRHKLTRWSDVTTAEADSPIVGNQAQRVQELGECLEYFTKLKQERAGGPAGFDLVTMLAQDAATKDQPAHEFLGNLMLLIVGGNDTTRNSMSGSINAFNKFPDQFEKLKENLELLPNAVSEVIRWQTPLAHMRRTAVRDTEVAGKAIKKGDKVVMWYYSGNRDTEVFDDPDRIDIERTNARNQMSFGFGIHRCLGMRLGELQLQILWEEIIKRFDRIETLEEPTRVLSNFINGYTRMPVKVHSRT
ncbi:MAG: cytochrome P450, partial [Pseudomonadota bacterium]|nr:cytochrome P450 [Pseudomonadota bacterium]